jgi:hypothetical protein
MIRAAVGEEQFANLEAAVNESGPHETRVDRLVSLASASGMEVGRDDLEKFSQLNHRRVRTAQLADIQCTNCHSYGSEKADKGSPPPAHHFSVNTTSCYTCHFNNEGFNTGTNTCLMCHKQLPMGEIIVHKDHHGGTKAQSPELTTKMLNEPPGDFERKGRFCAISHRDSLDFSEIASGNCPAT